MSQNTTKVKIPCEECLVFARCKARYSRPGASIICGILWKYIVIETSREGGIPSNWMTSPEFQMRKGRLNRLKEIYPSYKCLQWNNDLL